MLYHIFLRLTVQASIGAIALSEGLACGEIVLTASVIAIIFTSPVGAILIDWLKSKIFLQKLIEKVNSAMNSRKN